LRDFSLATVLRGLDSVFRIALTVAGKNAEADSEESASAPLDPEFYPVVELDREGDKILLQITLFPVDMYVHNGAYSRS